MKIVEDVNAIRQRLYEMGVKSLSGEDIKPPVRECMLRSDDRSAVSNCWCFRAGPDGTHLPCPPQVE